MRESSSKHVDSKLNPKLPKVSGKLPYEVRTLSPKRIRLGKVKLGKRQELIRIQIRQFRLSMTKIPKFGHVSDKFGLSTGDKHWQWSGCTRHRYPFFCSAFGVYIPTYLGTSLIVQPTSSLLYLMRRAAC